MKVESISLLGVTSTCRLHLLGSDTHSSESIADGLGFTIVCQRVRFPLVHLDSLSLLGFVFNSLEYRLLWQFENLLLLFTDYFVIIV